MGAFKSTEELVRSAYGVCALGDARNCMGGRCKECGWSRAEIERRAGLPLHRNRKGLWQKRVGRRNGGQG